MPSALRGLLEFLATWLLFRDVSPKNEDAWEGVALAKTHDFLTDQGEDAAQDLADLWQLDHDHEREEALRGGGDE